MLASVIVLGDAASKADSFHDAIATDPLKFIGKSIPVQPTLSCFLSLSVPSVHVFIPLLQIKNPKHMATGQIIRFSGNSAVLWGSAAFRPTIARGLALSV